MKYMYTAVLGFSQMLFCFQKHSSSSVMLYCLTDCLFVCCLVRNDFPLDSVYSWFHVSHQLFFHLSQHFPSLNSLHVHVGVFFLNVMFTVIKLSIKSVPRERSLIICKTLYIPGFFNLVPRASTRDRKKTDTGNEVQLDI